MDQTASGLFASPSLLIGQMDVVGLEITALNTSQIVGMTFLVSKAIKGDVFTKDYVRLSFNPPLFNHNPNYGKAASITLVPSDNTGSVSIQYLILSCSSNC
jgi:hypothetical protein